MGGKSSWKFNTCQQPKCHKWNGSNWKKIKLIKVFFGLDKCIYVIRISHLIYVGKPIPSPSNDPCPNNLLLLNIRFYFWLNNFIFIINMKLFTTFKFTTLSSIFLNAQFFQRCTLNNLTFFRASSHYFNAYLSSSSSSQVNVAWNLGWILSMEFLQQALQLLPHKLECT